MARRSKASSTKRVYQTHKSVRLRGRLSETRDKRQKTVKRSDFHLADLPPFGEVVKLAKSISKVLPLSENPTNKKAQKPVFDSPVRWIETLSPCRARRKRRRAIMAKTGGKGLKVKKAVWKSTSFLICGTKK